MSVLLAGVAIAVIAAPAVASSLDLASTKKFIAAETRSVAAAVAKHGAEEAGANAFIKHIESRCRGALPGYLRTGTASQQRIWEAFIFGEGSSELALGWIRPLRPDVAAEARELQRLRWSRPAITHPVAAIARTDRAMLALKPPDICDQVRASAADGFKALPPATSRFLRVAGVAFPDSDSLPSTVELLSMMKSFFTPSERPAIKQLHNLERRLDRLNGLFLLHAWVRMAEALRGS